MSNRANQPPTSVGTSLSEWRDFIRWNFCFWLLLATVGWLIRFAITQSAAWSLVLTAVQDSSAFALSCLLWLVLRRTAYNWPPGFAVALQVTVLCLAAALINATLSHCFVAVVEWQHPAWTIAEAASYRTTFFWLAFMLWSSTWIAFNSWHRLINESSRAARAEAEAARHELQMLRSRLTPHFLCNALNGITANISANPAAARAMLCELADYLRFSLEQNQQVTVSLEEEFKALDHYLQIEKARFGDKLLFDITLDPAVASVPVPAFLLQPLVENAIKFGSVPDTAGKSMMTLTARPSPSGVTITITNNGDLDSAAAARGGTGLSIVRRCLQLHYPGGHSFSIEENGGCVTASIHIDCKP